MKTTLLTRSECNVLRGIAILGIVLHNYCHWLGPVVKENEYTFTRDHCDGLLMALLHPDALLPAHLLSFFGHYGVPVFLFLSGFGLVLKYEQPDRGGALRAASFMRYHFLKLFKMMIVGFVAFTMLDAITPGRHHYEFIDVVAQLGMFNNLLPNPDHIIWPGPYWFFGLMLQLYLVYALLIHRFRHPGVAVALVAVCWLLQAFCAPEGDALNRLRYNCIGGMLPFIMGIILGRAQLAGRPLFRQQAGERQGVRYGLLLLIATLVAFLMSFAFQTWLWVPALIVMASIGLVKLLPATLSRWLEWTGTISAALFVCHPITRKIFIPLSRQGDVYTGLLLYVIASIAVAWVFHLLMNKIPNPRKA